MKNQVRITLAGSLLISASAPVAAGQIAATQDVMGSDDWQTLKSIWRLLDRVKPSEDDFGISIATEKGDSLNSAIRSLFLDDEMENPQLELAISIVSKIASARVTRLSRMNPLYMTRMMPPWTDTVQDHLMFNFENRISSLSSLIEAEEITATEFIAARDSLIDRAETLALLEILDDVRENQFYDRGGIYGLVNPGSDEILEALDMSYRVALDTLQADHLIENKEYYHLVIEQHEEFLLRYENFQEAKPVLRILLSDLMEAGN